MSLMMYGNDLKYLANGNMVCDAVRGINAIRYNMLNLPDTIQFINGNQIVNLYDASGHKYKSIAYTVIPTTVTAHYEVEHYTFDTDTVEYLVTEYTGNTELCYTRTDTLSQRIFNSIGYYSDSTYYHYIKDHLGNVCAVVNSAADTVVQSTLYYASGVPMAQSFGREKQPYLYNGKELVEAHGWNTYDYGFRGYYATIGRFTSIDPLAEQTPWQSPYVYAGNNYINNIDWMGLGGVTSMANGNVPHYIVIGPAGEYLGGVNNDDWSIYIDPDGNWKPKDGKDDLERVGRMMFPFWVYENWIGKGHKAPGLYYGQISLSATFSMGMKLEQKFNTPITTITLGMNLFSLELAKFSIFFDEDYSSELSYMGENNRLDVSHGIGLGFVSFDQTFQVYKSDMEYVPATTRYILSFTSEKGLGTLHNTELNFSVILASISISLSIDFYYQPMSE